MDSVVAKVISQIRPFSMVPDDAIELTVMEVLKAIKNEHKGDFAEFGTWMGGCSFAMLLIQREMFGKIIKPVWMFDSFEGLPNAEERDGPAALRYQSDTESPIYYNNCTAPLEQVLHAKESFGFSDDDAIIVPGWFEKSIPLHRQQIFERGLSLLRIDCDWYRPVKLVLDEIAPLVTENASIVIDDYFSWDGCALAVHAYLAENELPYRIQSLPSLTSAWIVKKAAK
jgi:O-methyltransferase